MRIARLDLARYGRFTDQSLDLPRRETDFHLLVGPNEAGKSTLRGAILDLLFGIEMRSPYNFLHAYPDMRLGALIEEADAALDFRRVKARNRTLRDAADAVLPDTALAPFLGGIERGFFEQMFGLDHGRLVAGGRDILSAANDVGQILFQSAAGIASFGAVRDALEKEADALWTKRRRGDGEYYIAADELARAQETLKQVTVRTRDYVSARDEVERLEQESASVRARYEALAQRRARLERARRTAPILNGLREREAALEALGAVRPLPADAARQLDDAEQAMAVAARARQVHDAHAAQLAEALAGIQPDAALLAREQDVDALAAQREQVRNHTLDIAKRQEEARGLWKTLEGLTRGLGWPVDTEENLAARLPSQVVRTAAGELIRRHDTLAQAAQNAREAREGKQGELEELDQVLAGLAAGELPPALVSALAAAQALGDVGAQERRLADQVGRAERELAGARAALAPWPAEPEGLREMHLPGSEEQGALRVERDRLQSENEGIARRIVESQEAIADLDLEISQYQAAHQPVSQGELAAARDARDGLWREMRAGAAPLATAADPYEGLVTAADALADRRHDKAQEAATLQSKRDARERLAAQITRLEASAARIGEHQARQAAAWEARTEALGLPGITLAQIGPWSAARERVLSAAETLAEARAHLDTLRRQAAEAREALAVALTPPPQHPAAPEPGESLAALVARAATWVDEVRRAQERHRTLGERRAAAAKALETLARRQTQAEEALAVWRQDWGRCLADLALPAATGIGAAEGALSILAQMDDHLRRVRELREARINPMRRDLDAFTATARHLARELALESEPGLTAQPPEEIAHTLSARLAQARQDAHEHRRLTAELEAARERAAEEARRIDAAQAALAPLLHAAGAPDTGTLREAITRSDQARALETELTTLGRGLADGSDGLPRETLEAELADLDPGTIPGELSTLELDLEQVLELQRENAAALRTAQTQLERIAGQDDAARAEAERQEALARMGNAVERYLRTYTAARLLRWAIERYREARQGPMLGRAGDIFAELTLGSFARLVVDYDRDPPVLHGQRPNAERVAIEGMSDGTRDQLYLALRLAALELHLEQSQPMPFIADDLFINWDEGRSTAGLAALARLSTRTQVLFLTHHEHLVPQAEGVFAGALNVIRLG